VLKQLLGELDLAGVLIQADALHTQRPFSTAQGAGGRLPPDRCRRSLPRSGEPTKRHCIARSGDSFRGNATSLSRQVFSRRVMVVPSPGRSVRCQSG
jgi:hypothetical protein